MDPGLGLIDSKPEPSSKNELAISDNAKVQLRRALMIPNSVDPIALVARKGSKRIPARRDESPLSTWKRCGMVTMARKRLKPQSVHILKWKSAASIF